MRKFLSASALLFIGAASAIKTEKPTVAKALAQTQAQGYDCGKVTYDYTCKYQRDQDCLVNSINLYGPKVVLVNLDDRCRIEKLEREGIFLQTGDFVIVTGRENSAAGQEWKWENGYDHKGYNFDYDILFPSLDYDLPVISEPGA